jgi:predicted PurR-regulated permease PerM
MNSPGAASDPADGPSSGAAREHTRLLSGILLVLGTGLFLALPYVLESAAVVFLPVTCALILSIALSPLADHLMRLRIPNFLASILAIVGLIAVVAMALTLILLPAVDLIDRVPSMVNAATREFVALRSNFTWVNDFNRQLAKLTGNAPTREVVLAAPSMIERVAFATPSVVLEVLLTLLMTFFMIEARVRLRQRLLLDRGTLNASLKAARVLRDVQDRVGGYILTVALINSCVGVIVACGAWALGMDAPIMWGGLAALLNFLPYIGPIAMGGIIALFGIGSGDGILAGLIPAAAYLVLHVIEADFITPSILGARFTLNPVVILVSISYFTWIWGVIGALLSVPIVITLAALFEHTGKPDVVGFLFGEPLFLPPPAAD